MDSRGINSVRREGRNKKSALHEARNENLSLHIDAYNESTYIF